MALAVLSVGTVQAQQAAPPPSKSESNSEPAVASAIRPNAKPAPPSASNPKAEVKSITKFYPASSQETADAILADSLGRLFAHTDAHSHKGEYNHVVNLNRIIVQGDPHNVDAYSDSAFLLWSTTRNDEAIAFIKAGIIANPNTYYMYDEMGVMYWLHLHDPAAAIPYYEQAVKCKDCYFITWHGLAHCYEKTNQWDKAVHAWESAAQYLKDAVAPSNLARARTERDKRKSE